MTYSEKINRDYLEKLRKANLLNVKPKTEWVILHKRGDGIIASPAFNFQVYKNKKGNLTLVTNDDSTLQRVLRGERISEEGKRIVLIDDSGWGFPLGGVLCGAYDFQTNQFYKREIEVEYFQGERFQRKSYLERYRERAIEIVDKINPAPEETMIKICSGYINLKAKEALRENFLVVEIDRVGEPLQSWLEGEHRKYLQERVRKDIYYDPKGLSKGKIARRYDEVIKFAEKYNLMHLAKTGWGSFQGQPR